MATRVVMAGATGWVGRAMIPALLSQPDLELAGAVARGAAGEDAGTAVGLAPAGLHRSYLVVPESVSLAQRRGPSTFMACQLCAGIVATEALKILLGRGKVLAAPHGMQFDAYNNRMKRTWRPGGNRHPIQRLAIAIGKRQFGRRSD